MAFESDYQDFFQSMSHSDTHRFRFVVRDPDTLTVQSIGSWQQFWVTAKVNLTDIENVFQLTLGTGIAIIDAPNGVVEVTIIPINTGPLGYQHYDLPIDIQGKSPGGDIFTLARGTLTVVPDATRVS